MNTHYRLTILKSQFTIGNWVIGLPALQHVAAAYNNDRQFALKARWATLLMTIIVGQMLIIRDQLKSTASVTKLLVAPINGGSVHGSYAQ